MQVWASKPDFALFDGKGVARSGRAFFVRSARVHFTQVAGRQGRKTQGERAFQTYVRNI